LGWTEGGKKRDLYNWEGDFFKRKGKTFLEGEKK
jgi:hypothetical protein